MTLHLTKKKKKKKKRNRNLMTEVQFKIIKIILHLPCCYYKRGAVHVPQANFYRCWELPSFLFRALTPSTISLLLLCKLFFSLESFHQPLNTSNFLDPTSSLNYSPLFFHTTILFEKAIKYMLEMLAHSILYWLCAFFYNVPWL